MKLVTRLIRYILLTCLLLSSCNLSGTTASPVATNSAEDSVQSEVQEQTSIPVEFWKRSNRLDADFHPALDFGRELDERHLDQVFWQ